MNNSMIGGADGLTAIFLVIKADIFLIAAFGIMGLFYGIYFIKQLTQKKQGIITRQLGRRKEKSLHTTEVIMSLATVLIVIVEIFSILFELSLMPMPVRKAGISWGSGIPDCCPYHEKQLEGRDSRY